VYVVVAYDISNDRRRARLAKRLIDFLPRVQMSVFEGEIPDRRFHALQEAIEAIIDPTHDRVRIYRLCARCSGAATNLGAGADPHDAAGQDIVLD